MKFLVTGGTGTVGSSIVRYLLKKDYTDIVVFSRDEHKQYELKQELGSTYIRYIIGDVRSYDALYDALQNADICFHTAAMKHVPICEENPFEAVETNIIGTRNLIKAAADRHLKKVLAISTDKAVHPTSVLGCTKLVMERLLKAAKGQTKFASIRFGNILNSRGSVIPLWKQQIANGDPVTVTDAEATRYFVEIDEAVKAAFEAVRCMNGGEVFIFSRGKPKRIIDMAKELVGVTNVPIKVTGLRQGERLHEVLSASNEPVIDRDGLAVI